MVSLSEREEDALKVIHNLPVAQVGAAALAAALGVAASEAQALLTGLKAKGLASAEADGFVLTGVGRERARKVIRAHRVFETWLAQRTATPPTEWHRVAHEAEHRLTDAEVDDMARSLGFPRVDPHGDPIPRRDGAYRAPENTPLAECPVGWEGRVAHIEDEPDAVFQSLAAMGIHAGMRLRVRRNDKSGAELNLEGSILELNTVQRAQIECNADPEAPLLEGPQPVLRLNALAAGVAATVECLSPQCRGPERSRLLDLGLVPGSPIRVAFPGPFGSPRAYRIRSTVIALRDSQAEHVIVRQLAPSLSTAQS